MKAGKYTIISTILFAITFIVFILVKAESLFIGIIFYVVGFDFLNVMAFAGIIVSLVSVIKERVRLSVITFSMFLLMLVNLMVVPAVERYISDYKNEKREEMTDSDWIDIHENITGKRPLLVLDRGSDYWFQQFLLDMVRIDCDTIGDGDILLQYEVSKISPDYSLLKGWSRNNIRNLRDIKVVHYMHCEDEEKGYNIRYYDWYSYLYYCKNGISTFFYETDVYVENKWEDGREDLNTSEFQYYMLLEYYKEHKSEIPVIADDIRKKRTYVKSMRYEDRYELEFSWNLYENIDVIAEHLQEHFGATIFDKSNDENRSASVKIRESVMKLHTPFHYVLEGSLSDIPLMEEIADYFEVYMADNHPSNVEDTL